MINVLIVEDFRMAREAMENYIKNTEGYCVVDSIGNAALAEMSCMQHKVDLVLMDVCTEEGESGFEATRRIKKRFPEIKVVVVTSMIDFGFLEKARDVQADSIWFKDMSHEELMQVVQRTMAGESVYPDHTPTVRLGNTDSASFSDAEIRVLRLLVEGMTYRQIAAALNLSVDTVKSHTGSMLAKTGFSSKTKLAAEVVSKNLIVNNF